MRTLASLLLNVGCSCSSRNHRRPQFFFDVLVNIDPPDSLHRMDLLCGHTYGLGYFFSSRKRPNLVHFLTFPPPGLTLPATLLPPPSLPSPSYADTYFPISHQNSLSDSPSPYSIPDPLPLPVSSLKERPHYPLMAVLYFPSEISEQFPLGTAVSVRFCVRSPADRSPTRLSLAFLSPPLPTYFFPVTNDQVLDTPILVPATFCIFLLLDDMASLSSSFFVPFSRRFG